jgi:hypothetical protein
MHPSFALPNADCTATLGAGQTMEGKTGESDDRTSERVFDFLKKTIKN